MIELSNLASNGSLPLVCPGNTPAAVEVSVSPSLIRRVLSPIPGKRSSQFQARELGQLALDLLEFVA
jgi:hypothetical protein